jgi:protein PhnA
MSYTLPSCPKCNSAFICKDSNLVVCPEFGHEWNLDEASTIMAFLAAKDAYGTLLQDGNMVTMIKDLKVKSYSSAAKVGAKVKINRLVDGDHNVDCKVIGIGAMMLKSEFVKTA